MRRLAAALRYSSAALLAAVAFVPYVSVGTQRYAAIGFFERVGALSSMAVVDASWQIPPVIALLAGAAGPVLLLIPSSIRTPALTIAAGLAFLGAASSYWLVAQTAIIGSLAAPRLLVLGGTTALLAALTGRDVIIGPS